MLQALSKTFDEVDHRAPEGRRRYIPVATPEGRLERGPDGLFRSAAGELDADPAARVQQGALEGSNVSAVETMIAMISAARQFEQQMKMLQSAEQKEQAATKLLSPNGL